MSIAPLPAEPADTTRPGTVETEAEWQDRLAWEAEGIAEADHELEAGLHVDAAELRAWVESIGTDYELPPPPTRHR